MRLLMRFLLYTITGTSKPNFVKSEGLTQILMPNSLKSVPMRTSHSGPHRKQYKVLHICYT